MTNETMIKCLKELTAVSEAKTSRILRKLIAILHDDEEGGGGGGECGCEPLIVTETEISPGQVQLSVSYNDIKAALEANRVVYMRATFLDESMETDDEALLMLDYITYSSDQLHPGYMAVFSNGSRYIADTATDPLQEDGGIQ